MHQKICYYITGFGFGHLTRSLAIIEQLLTIHDDVEIMIKADTRLLAKAEQYLKKYAGRISLHPFHSHFSIFFNPVTFCVDLEAIKEDALRWIKNLPASIESETIFLREHKATLVLSDIVPEAFSAAARMGIPGVGISNFTWYEICTDIFGQDERLNPLFHMYNATSEFLLFPFSTGELVPMERRTNIGPVTRPFDHKKIEQIRDRYKIGTRPLAFLSVGGSTRVEDFPLRKDMDYLVTMGIEVQDIANVHRLPQDVHDSHNYLAACDVVITKCGWSTVAEATLAGIPMWLMLSKNGWLEERCIYKEITSLGIGVDRSFADMESMTSTAVMAELGSLKRAYAQLPLRYHNGMGRIMEIIEGYLEAGG